MAAVTGSETTPTETPSLITHSGLNLSAEKLKLLIEDDTFLMLNENFLTPPGRGRPKNSTQLLLSSVQVTHRLLVQLHFLKEEDDTCTFADLREWACRLDSTLTNVTLSRITHHVTSTYKACLQMTEEAVRPFLEELFYFHALSLPLSSLGLNRLHLLDVQSFVPKQDILIINFSIVRALEHFQVQEALPTSFVVKWLKQLNPHILMTDSQIRSKIISICKKIRTLVKSKKIQVLNNLLVQSFFPNLSSPAPTPVLPHAHSTAEKEVTELRKTKDILQSKLTGAEMKIAILKEERQDLRLENERLCQTENLLYKKTKESKHLTRQLRDMDEQLDQLNQSRTYKMNVSLRKDITTANKKMDTVSNENKNLKLQIGKMERNLKLAQKGKSNFKRKLEDEKESKQALLDFKAMDDAENATPLLKKDKSNKYTDSVRLAYMDLQGKTGVAAAKCSEVVQIVSRHLFGQDYCLKDLPSSSTAFNFADEAHHIAMHQVVDRIKNTDHYIYASDGTSRQKQHYLERHIILADKTQLSVGFAEIASDDANTLLEKTLELLHELSDIYCIDSENEIQKRDDVFKELVRKMKCLMSDRAAVNKSFNKKLSKFRQDYLGDENVTTHFVYCNAHFLLGLTQATQDALKEVERQVREDEDCPNGLGRDMQQKFSSFSNSTSESAAIRLIRTASECLGPRCDEKNGSRVNWLAYCDNVHIKSKFLSFRNNRFNNIFENAAATIYHHQNIPDFFNHYNFHSNLKLQSVAADAADNRILAMVGAVALFNTMITGCYWKLMNSFLPYGAFPQYVKKLESTLEHLASHGIERTCDVTSVFEEYSIEDNATTDFIFSGSHNKRDIWMVTLKTIARNSLSVLKRQLTDFLTGEIYGDDLDEETKRILDTCPFTNLSGERLFGDLDYDMLKRRHATTHHRSSVTMWKHNKTAAGLERQNAETKAQIMDSAVKNRKALREKHLDSVRREREIVKVKLIENQEKMKEKEIKDAETQTSILDSIIRDGGVCTTKTELDELFNSTTEALRTQIRYRKMFKNQKHLRLTGTKKVLYETLLRQIELEVGGGSERRLADINNLSASEGE